ncbi:hypothetical protein [Bradyrhizobium sp. BRP56]|uniref:hypothetical protein n=1 Tax=Bradyrhizobium sp. BRP56 TaxID=2793819 RepID=UPI001CD7AAAA|nr:hypothetical protein [Bradyrhizobium sp. BRP56]MCA1400207.1 hypothetical protein [Bradyrhizobium sp. BRP56]
MLCGRGVDDWHAVLDAVSLAAAEAAQETTLPAVLVREDGAQDPSAIAGPIRDRCAASCFAHDANSDWVKQGLPYLGHGSQCPVCQQEVKIELAAQPRPCTERSHKHRSKAILRKLSFQHPGGRVQQDGQIPRSEHGTTLTCQRTPNCCGKAKTWLVFGRNERGGPHGKALHRLVSSPKAQFRGAIRAGTQSAAEIRRGRWMDNVFIERLWRSLKHEDIVCCGSQASA